MRPPGGVGGPPGGGPPPAGLEQVRRLSRLMDTSFTLPGGFKVGWDAILGLIPGFGDGAGAVVSAYIVLQAVRMGAPSEVLMRMIGNVAVEAIVGAVPVLGDVFDAAWRSNVRNVTLLEQHLNAPRTTRRASRLWVAAVVLLFVLVAVGGIALTVLVVRGLDSLLRGG